MSFDFLYMFLSPNGIEIICGNERQPIEVKLLLADVGVSSTSDSLKINAVRAILRELLVCFRLGRISYRNFNYYRKNNEVRPD